MDKVLFAEGLMNLAHGLSVIAEALGGPSDQVEPPAPPVSEPPAPPVSEPPAPPVSEKPPTREEVVSYFREMSQVVGSDAAKAAVAKILADMEVKAFKDIPEEKLGVFLALLRTVRGAPANA